MTNCQGCGTEILGQDRFCKNCGAPVAASVEDLADTRPFDPSAPARAAATASPHDLNSSFQVAAPTTWPLAHGFASLPKRTAFIKNMLKRPLVWLMAFLLVFVLMGSGLVIGRDVIRARRSQRAAQASEAKRIAAARQARQAQAAQRSVEESVRNAFGFTAAKISEAEYPDIQGVFVASLTSDNSPAAVAGIQAGDLLTELNGQAVPGMVELGPILNSLKPGSEVGVKVIRDEQTISSSIRVASQSVPPFEPKIEPKDQGFLGVGDAGRRCCIPGTKKWGLEVHRIIDNSPADLAGLQLGDVITEFEKQNIRTPDELARRIHAAKPRSKVKVKFYRGTTEQTVELILGHGW